jgi:tRNA pseudouridine55 synthase
LKLESNGLLLINKPKNYTSRDIVNILSKTFETKKIGHNGTLDPLATGVLVICLNRYTKLNEILSAKEKEYIAEVTLGIKTDTLDITGNILEKENQLLKKEDLMETLQKFKTTYNQEVPLYSAVKVNGKKLYEYARNNQPITLPKKEVTIKNIQLLTFEKNKFTFKCTVSKGTYIRSLIRDILADLHIIGTMSNLTRTKQGLFDIKDSYTLDDIKNNHYKILQIKDVLNLKQINADEATKKKVINGMPIDAYQKQTLILYKEKELAIYKNGKIEVLL